MNTDSTDPKINPVPGDQLRNKRFRDHPTRTVYDRDLGGRVYYIYDRRSGYTGRCSIEEWMEFSEKAVVLKIAENRKP